MERRSSFQGCVATGNQGASYSRQARPLGLPLNPLECVPFYVPTGNRRTHYCCSRTDCPPSRSCCLWHNSPHVCFAGSKVNGPLTPPARYVYTLPHTLCRQRLP